MVEAAGVELTRQQTTQLALHGGFRVSTRKMRRASSSPWLSMVDDGGTDWADGWVTGWAQDGAGTNPTSPLHPQVIKEFISYRI